MIPRYITVTVYNYLGRVSFYNTYIAINFADAIKQMEKEYTLTGTDSHIECK